MINHNPLSVNAGCGCVEAIGEAQWGATSTIGAIVKVSRENLALAVLWGAISACALLTLISPKMTAPGIDGSRLSGIVASLARTGF